MLGYTILNLSTWSTILGSIQISRFWYSEKMVALGHYKTYDVDIELQQEK